MKEEVNEKPVFLDFQRNSTKVFYHPQKTEDSTGVFYHPQNTEESVYLTNQECVVVPPDPDREYPLLAESPQTIFLDPSA